MRIFIVRNILFTALILSISSCFGTQLVFANTASASKYRELGLVYRASERYPEAITALKKSVQLEPQNLSTRTILGWTLHLAGKEDAAIEALLQAVSQNLFDVPTLNALGIVYLVNGDLTNAVVVHSWAAILKPKNEIAYYNLSLAYHRLENYRWAIATANRAIALEPSNPHPLVASAIAHWDSGDRLLAQKVYHLALSLDLRYRDRTFLTHLKQAGFSPAQIQTAEKVLIALPN